MAARANSCEHLGRSDLQEGLSVSSTSFETTHPTFELWQYSLALATLHCLTTFLAKDRARWATKLNSRAQMSLATFSLFVLIVQKCCACQNVTLGSLLI